MFSCIFYLQTHFRQLENKDTLSFQACDLPLYFRCTKSNTILTASVRMKLQSTDSEAIEHSSLQIKGLQLRP